MESSGSARECCRSPREPQCPLVVPVGRRSVEVRHRLEDIFSTTGAEGGEREAESRRWTSDSDSSASRGLTDHVDYTQDLPLEELLGEEVAESRHLDAKEPVPERAKVKEKVRRQFSPRPLIDGYEAAFLRERIKEMWERDSCFPSSSPSESLGELLYRKNKNVLDYTVTDVPEKGIVQAGSSTSRYRQGTMFVSDLPSSRYIKRRERTEHTELWRDQGSHIKAATGLTSDHKDGGPHTYGLATTPSSSAASPSLRRNTSDISRQEVKRSYYKDLSLQVKEKKQLVERQKRQDAMAERTHNETMENFTWGKPGSGAPNYHLGSVRRNKFSFTGIVPQEQLRCKGFCGTPFHLRVK